MNVHRYNKLAGNISTEKDRGILSEKKIDGVLNSIFDVKGNPSVMLGDVVKNITHNTVINLVNISLEDNRILGDKITLDGNVLFTKDFYLDGIAHISGIIESNDWGLSTGGQLDLENSTLKFGGCLDPNFSIDSNGNIVAKSGEAAGFNIDVTEGFYAGVGVTRVQMKSGAGIWAGATAFVDAPVSLSNAGAFKALNATVKGVITANTGYIGGTSGWTIGSKTLTGASDSKIISGILQSSDWGAAAGSQLDLVNKTLTFGGSSSYKFKIDSSGNITAKGGGIGGWTIGANKISIAGIDIDQANSRIKVYTGSNYVEMKPAGLFGYDSVLGTTVKIPTNGDAPEFSKGIMKEFIYEIYTSGVIRTNVNPAVNGGMLINNATMTGYAPESGGARFFVDYAGSNPGDVKIGDYTGGKGLFWDQSETVFTMKGILDLSAAGKVNLAGNSELTASHLYLTQNDNEVQIGTTTGMKVVLLKSANSAYLRFYKDNVYQAQIILSDTDTEVKIGCGGDVNGLRIYDGYCNSDQGFRDNGTPGIDTTFLDADGNTITSSGGIITAKTAP